VAHYRLEFVHESADQVMRVARAFDDALNGRMDHAALRKQLQIISPEGVTEGSLFVPANYLEVSKL
jgi:putative protease